MGVSKNNGTPKSSIFNRVFHHKPSILGYPYFWKHPYIYVYCGFTQLALQMFFCSRPKAAQCLRCPGSFWLVGGTRVELGGRIPVKTWYILSHRMHGTCILYLHFTIKKNQPNLGKWTRTMDGISYGKSLVN